MNLLNAPRTAFVLGGGGKWGAVEVGMLAALTDAGIEPDLIVGTSIGAINGAVYATDPSPIAIERLESLWKSPATREALSGSMLTRLKNVGQLRPALNDHTAIRELLRTTVYVRHFDELAVSFQCVAASIERAAERWFSDGDLVEALLASASVPGLFPPVEIDGEHYYDGGLVNSVPVDRAIRLGATELYVLQVGRIEKPLRPPSRIHEPALVAFEIARRHRFGTLMDDPPCGITLHVLPTGKPVDYTDTRQLRWSDLGDTPTMIETARAATAAYLAEAGEQR